MAEHQSTSAHEDLKEKQRCCSSLLKTIGNNFYNLSREEFELIRRNENNPELHLYYLELFRQSELYTFEGISWFNAFIDLIYVMVVFKVDDILIHCAKQPNREVNLTASFNVFLISISFFTIMFFTRYQMDHYSCSFMQLTKKRTYPLLQSDFFHRIIIVFYGLGTFIMTMNIVLLEYPEESLKNDSDVQNNPQNVGACHFHYGYSVGFAAGFLMTRGIMIIVYLCIMLFAKDSYLRNGYRITFSYYIIRNIIAIILISLLWLSNDQNHNLFAIVLIPIVAFSEVIQEFLWGSIAQWQESYLLSHPIDDSTTTTTTTTTTSSTLTTTTTPSTPPATNPPWYVIHIIHNARQENDVILAISRRPSISNNKQGSAEISSSSTRLTHELFCDGPLLQDRLSLFFMLILGESFIGILSNSYDPTNKASFAVQVLVYLLLTSTGMQFFETVDKGISEKEHGILAPYPYSHMFIWMHVVVSFTLLVATCGIVGLYSNAVIVFPSHHHHPHDGKSVAPTLAPSIAAAIAFSSDQESNEKDPFPIKMDSERTTKTKLQNFYQQRGLDKDKLDLEISPNQLNEDLASTYYTSPGTGSTSFTTSGSTTSTSASTGFSPTSSSTTTTSGTSSSTATTASSSTATSSSSSSSSSSIGTSSSFSTPTSSSGTSSSSTAGTSSTTGSTSSGTSYYSSLTSSS
jgi:hypothetical protein